MDEAIPILEKWYDDVIAESERLKKQSVQAENIENQTSVEENKPNINEQPAPTASVPESVAANQNTENKTSDKATQAQTTESSEVSKRIK